jgi:hypothetical protein
MFALLLVAEALTKTIALALVSRIADDKDRHRYRIEYDLARADGIGDWGRAIEDALTGHASQYLLADARPLQLALAQASRRLLLHQAGPGKCRTRVATTSAKGIPGPVSIVQMPSSLESFVTGTFLPRQ